MTEEELVAAMAAPPVRDAERVIADDIRAGLADVQKLINEAESMGLRVKVSQGELMRFSSAVVDGTDPGRRRVSSLYARVTKAL